ncbi:MAG: hemolysin family protein [Nanoarchaeota archaeon]
MALLMLVISILLIVILSGLISGSEAAILSISYTKTKEISKTARLKSTYRKAKRLVRVKENLRTYITTIVILNNIVNIVGSIYVGILAANMFPGNEIVVGLISGILTFLIIMFAEILPKVIGEKFAKTISLNIAGPLIFFTVILKPIVWFFTGFTSILVKEKDDEESLVSEGEIREMAHLGFKEGSINSYERYVINNVFKMNDIEAYNIMIPKSEVVCIKYEDTIDDIVKVIESTGFTRFPVLNAMGEIIGLINAKDLFRYHGKEEGFSVSKIMRPVLYAPESMKIFTLEQKLKVNRTHMAIIVNEHGDFTGIVALEDIIEELLGDIEDEFDKEEESIKKISEKKYHVKANIEISELNDMFNLGLRDLDEEDYSTINGFLISKLDRIPKVNDTYRLGETAKFRVIKANKKKVLEVELYLYSK